MTFKYCVVGGVCLAVGLFIGGQGQPGFVAQPGLPAQRFTMLAYRGTTYGDREVALLADALTGKVFRVGIERRSLFVLEAAIPPWPGYEPPSRTYREPNKAENEPGKQSSSREEPSALVRARRRLAAYDNAAFVTTDAGEVYHKSGCTHLKRTALGKMNLFANRQKASQGGRRPCKTCKP